MDVLQHVEMDVRITTFHRKMFLVTKFLALENVHLKQGRWNWRIRWIKLWTWDVDRTGSVLCRTAGNGISRIEILGPATIKLVIWSTYVIDYCLCDSIMHVVRARNWFKRVWGNDVSRNIGQTLSVGVSPYHETLSSTASITFWAFSLCPLK
jgi:hypothetical protein